MQHFFPPKIKKGSRSVVAKNVLRGHVDFPYQILCHVPDAGVRASAADSSHLSDSCGHRGPGPGQARPARANPCLPALVPQHNPMPHVSDQHPGVCPPLPWPCLTLPPLETKRFLQSRVYTRGSTVRYLQRPRPQVGSYIPTSLQRYLSELISQCNSA